LRFTEQEFGELTFVYDASGIFVVNALSCLIIQGAAGLSRSGKIIPATDRRSDNFSDWCRHTKALMIALEATAAQLWDPNNLIAENATAEHRLAEVRELFEIIVTRPPATLALGFVKACSLAAWIADLLSRDSGDMAAHNAPTARDDAAIEAAFRGG
jgi:hypothetical protein